MEKSNKGEPEETVELQDLAMQEEDSESLQSDQQLQKSEEKLMQQEPAQEVKTLYSLRKSEENESSLKRRRKFAADKALGQEIEGSIGIQQKCGSSFDPKQDLSKTNQSDTVTLHEECSVFLEDQLSEPYGNTTVQRTAKAPESIFLTLDQKSIPVTRQEDNVTHQDYDRSEKLKLEANLTEQLRERTLGESSVAFMKVPTMDERSFKPILPEQLRERTDREIARALIEDLRAAQEESGESYQAGELHVSESDQESENSDYVCFLCEGESSSRLPSRICYHRTHTQRQRFPPRIEEPDEPLDPHEVEIALSRYRRTLGDQPSRVPTGFGNYLQRAGEYHIPPESRDFLAEVQWRVKRFFCSLAVGAIVIVVMVFLINYLEDTYGNQGDSNVTSPDDDLSTAMTDFITDTSVICLETETTTPVVYSINFRTDFDSEVTSVLNNVDSTSTNPVNDLE